MRNKEQLNTKYNRILKKLKRYYFYEKKITSKLNIKNSEVLDLFFKEFSIDVKKAKKEYMVYLYESKTNPVLIRRTIRKPRSKDDWRKTYKNYLQSPKWKQVRENLFKLRGKKCEDCGCTNNIHVHHIHYNTFMNELPEDLKVLCESCHEKEHLKLNNQKLKNEARFNKNIKLYKRKGRVIAKHI